LVFVLFLENVHPDVIGSERNPIVIVHEDDGEDDDDDDGGGAVNDDDDDDEYYDWIPLDLGEFGLLQTYAQQGGKCYDILCELLLSVFGVTVLSLSLSLCVYYRYRYRYRYCFLKCCCFFLFQMTC